MPETLSHKQLDANRRNALKSTGPTTAQGKARSRRNALKHGLLAEEVLITDGDGAETRADFDSLLADLHEELQPHGVIEEMLVERVATCYWRLRRAQRYEVGAIRETLDECNRPEDDPDRESAEDVQQRLDDAVRSLAEQRRLAGSLQEGRLPQSLLAPDNSILTDPDAFRLLLPALDHLAADRNLSAYQPPQPPTHTDLFLSSLVPAEPPDTLESREAHARHTFLDQLDRAGLTGPDLHQALTEAQRNVIDDRTAEIARLQRELKSAQRYDRLRQSRRTLVGSLPAEQSLIKLVRYETMLDRQLHRALTELRRRQSARSPAPPRHSPSEGCPTPHLPACSTDTEPPTPGPADSPIARQVLYRAGPTCGVPAHSECGPPGRENPTCNAKRAVLPNEAIFPTRREPFYETSQIPTRRGTHSLTCHGRLGHPSPRRSPQSPT